MSESLVADAMNTTQYLSTMAEDAPPPADPAAAAAAPLQPAVSLPPLKCIYTYVLALQVLRTSLHYLRTYRADLLSFELHRPQSAEDIEALSWAGITTMVTPALAGSQREGSGRGGMGGGSGAGRDHAPA